MKESLLKLKGMTVKSKLKKSRAKLTRGKPAKRRPKARSRRRGRGPLDRLRERVDAAADDALLRGAVPMTAVVDDLNDPEAAGDE